MGMIWLGKVGLNLYFEESILLKSEFAERKKMEVGSKDGGAKETSQVNRRLWNPACLMDLWF